MVGGAWITIFPNICRLLVGALVYVWSVVGPEDEGIRLVYNGQLWPFFQHSCHWVCGDAIEVSKFFLAFLQLGLDDSQVW